MRSAAGGGITFDQNFALRRERQNGRFDRLRDSVIGFPVQPVLSALLEEYEAT